jgi:hypothetical protein
MDLRDLLDDLYGESRDKMSVESFDDLIQKLDMRPEYQIFLDKDGEVIINEEWSSLVSTEVKANRIYKFNIDSVNMILLEDRSKVLLEILNLYVDQENYEEAAALRDLMRNFNY